MDAYDESAYDGGMIMPSKKHLEENRIMPENHTLLDILNALHEKYGKYVDLRQIEETEELRK